MNTPIIMNVHKVRVTMFCLFFFCSASRAVGFAPRGTTSAFIDSLAGGMVMTRGAMGTGVGGELSGGITGLGFCSKESSCTPRLRAAGCLSGTGTDTGTTSGRIGSEAGAGIWAASCGISTERNAEPGEGIDGESETAPESPENEACSRRCARRRAFWRCFSSMRARRLAFFMADFEGFAGVCGLKTVFNEMYAGVDGTRTFAQKIPAVVPPPRFLLQSLQQVHRRWSSTRRTGARGQSLPYSW